MSTRYTDKQLHSEALRMFRAHKRVLHAQGDVVIAYRGFDILVGDHVTLQVHYSHNGHDDILNMAL